MMQEIKHPVGQVVADLRLFTWFHSALALTLKQGGSRAGLWVGHNPELDFGGDHKCLFM